MIERGPKPPPAQPGARGASDRPPRWLERPLRAALAADPARRPASMDDLLERLDPERHARRRYTSGMIVVGTLTAATAVMGWYVRSHRDAPSVRSPDVAPPAPAPSLAVCKASFAPPWDDGARTALRGLVVGTGGAAAPRIADRAVARLDAYATRWRTVRDAVCAPGYALAEVGTRCLEERRGRFAQLLEALPTIPPPELVVLDQTLVYLPGVEVCGTAGAAGIAATAALLDDPATAALASRLDASAAVGLAGDLAGEVVALDALAPEILARDVPALTAAFQLELAAAVDGTPRRADALAAAVAAATKAGLDEVAASAWLETIADAIDDGELDDARDALVLTDAVIARAGDDPVLRVEYDALVATLAMERGDLDTAARQAEAALARARQVAPELVYDLQQLVASVLHEQGKLDDALALDREVITQREAELGADHPLLADAHNQVASDLLMLGDTAGALAELEAAVALTEGAYGVDHLETARYRTNLAEALRNAGRFEEAVAMHRQARVALIAALGDDHVDVALSLENEAGALGGLGAWADAEAALRHALAIYVARLGDGAFETGKCRLNLAEALRGLRRYDDALTEDRAGLAALVAIYGDAHPYVGYARGDLGKSLLAAGRAAAAVTELDAALAIFAATEMDPAAVADVQLALARALTPKRGAIPARARDLAAEAAATFEAAGGEWTDDAARARAFLAKYDASR